MLKGACLRVDFQHAPSLRGPCLLCLGLDHPCSVKTTHPSRANPRGLTLPFLGERGCWLPQRLPPGLGREPRRQPCVPLLWVALWGTRDGQRPPPTPAAAAGLTRRPPWNPEAPPPPSLWSGRLTSAISDARPWPLTQGRKMDLRKQPQQSGEKLHFQRGQHFWWAVRNHPGDSRVPAPPTPPSAFLPAPPATPSTRAGGMRGPRSARPPETHPTLL